MNPVKIRNIEIGTGIPKICVPIVGKTKTEILETAVRIKKTDVQIAEWRVDWFKDILDRKRTEEILIELRNILEDIPVLFTFRTSREGGSRQISTKEYAELNQAAAETGLIDLIDIELYTGDELVKGLIRNAHDNRVYTVVSNHDFYETPSKEEIIFRLRKMQELGADIVKIAVMPQNTKDVITLLGATQEMTAMYARCPVVTMSMSEKGSVSRLCGEIFGSALTFAAAGQSSAPGQMPVADLAEGLRIMHMGIERAAGKE